MRRTVLIAAGLTLAGGTALALQEPTQDEYDTQSTDPYESGTTGTEDDAPSGDPEMGTLPEGEQDAYGTETGEQSAHDVTQMSADELEGMTVTTGEGEELGTIEQVGYSDTHQEKVATINVGGFLGVGEKMIAVPLSKLEMGSDDSIVTRMSREEIQSQPEFDPSDLSTGEQSGTGQSESQQDW
jgi:sporulation protein YlmC with PRC-barrel domain